jgi:hypothetical protein
VGFFKRLYTARMLGPPPEPAWGHRASPWDYIRHRDLERLADELAARPAPVEPASAPSNPPGPAVQRLLF